jgi:hypothetical protein
MRLRRNRLRSQSVVRVVRGVVRRSPDLPTEWHGRLAVASVRLRMRQTGRPGPFILVSLQMASIVAQGSSDLADLNRPRAAR